MGLDAEQVALAGRPIPAMRPVPEHDWLRVTSDYAAQVAEKARILERHPDEAVRRLPGSEAAIAEFGDMMIEALRRRPDFEIGAVRVTRPDGQAVSRQAPDALGLAARLLQEDVCILERRGPEHVLTAALLAFPASWSLAEKIGRPLSRIHAPVDVYNAAIAGRVQRMFDAVAPGKVLSRANLLRYADPALYQPRTETTRRSDPEQDRRFLRSERQTIRRLPRTGAIVFTILTTIVARDAAPPV